MKRLAILTTSLIAAVAAGVGANAAASAAAVQTRYPENAEFIKPLEFSDLTDYAVNGNEYAFAEGKTVFVYDGENLTEYEFSYNVTGLDCSEDVFYCSDSTGATYSLPYEQGQEETIYEMPESRTEITTKDGNFAYKLKDGTLIIADFETVDMHVAEGEYSNLKTYQDAVYAVRDNCLYRFDGAAENKINIEYSDYSVTDNISVGQTPDVLDGDYTLKFVKIKAGSYMTVVDMTRLEDDYFVTQETVTAAEDTLALLLCNTGNAAIVAVGDTSYILLSQNVSTVASAKYVSDPEFKAATILGNDVYSSPYVFMQPALSDAMNKAVEVVSKIDCPDVLGFVFYEIKYETEDGTQKSGYVTSGLLSGIYIPADNEDPEVVTDPDYSEKSDTRTILLVLAVVVLIVAALGYLAFVSTSGKRKKKETKNSKAKESAEK